MSTMSNISSVELLKSFAEAGNALEELPKVRADLEAAHSLIDETNAKLNAEQSHTATLAEKIASLEAALAVKEAALSDAMFRHGELAKVVEVIRGVIPSVQRPAEPEHSPTNVTTEAPQSPTPANNNEPAGTSSQVPTGHETPTVSQSSQNLTPQPEPYEGALQERLHDSSRDTNSGPSAEAPHSGSTSPTKGRYHNMEYWLKPRDMTWDDFAAEGGNVPEWIADRTQA